jgi:hypothetical protein
MTLLRSSHAAPAGGLVATTMVVAPLHANDCDDCDAPAIAAAAVYTGEMWRNASGGLETGDRYLDNLGLTVEVDGGRDFGAEGLTLFGYALYNNGHLLSDDVVGAAQESATSKPWTRCVSMSSGCNGKAARRRARSASACMTSIRSSTRSRRPRCSCNPRTASGRTFRSRASTALDLPEHQRRGSCRDHRGVMDVPRRGARWRSRRSGSSGSNARQRHLGGRSAVRR